MSLPKVIRSITSSVAESVWRERTGWLISSEDNLSVRTPQSTSMNRVVAFKREKVSRFFCVLPNSTILASWTQLFTTLMHQMLYVAKSSATLETAGVYVSHSTCCLMVQCCTALNKRWYAQRHTELTCPSQRCETRNTVTHHRKWDVCNQVASAVWLSKQYLLSAHVSRFNKAFSMRHRHSTVCLISSAF